MDDINTSYGTFHSGFFKAGKYVYESIKMLLDNNTHVYFVGHSYGGAVSATCVAMLKSMNIHAPVNGTIQSVSDTVITIMKEDA